MLQSRNGPAIVPWPAHYLFPSSRKSARVSRGRKVLLCKGRRAEMGTVSEGCPHFGWGGRNTTRNTVSYMKSVASAEEPVDFGSWLEPVS